MYYPFADYYSTANEFYDVGRGAFAAGEPRDNATSASNPNNPAAWDQRYKTQPSLQPHPEDPIQVFPVDSHFWFGWDDAKANWPDRNYRYSMGQLIRNPPSTYNGTDATRDRIYYLRWVYTRVWRDGGRSSLFATPEILTVISQAEFDWEVAQAKADLSAGSTPPIEGYKDPATAGIPGPGAAPPSSAPAATEHHQYPYDLYNWEAVLKSKRADRSRGGGFGGFAGGDFSTGGGGLNFGSQGGGLSNIWALLSSGRLG